MEKLLIYYGEIGLKGNNKSFFINKLKGSIVRSCKKENIKLISTKKEGSAILCELKATRTEIINCFKNILGIKYFMFVEEIELNKDKLFEKIHEICRKLKENNIKIIYPKTKRANKNFEMNSPQINAKIREIAKEYNLEVDYKNEKNILYIRINFKFIFISYERNDGPGGLPVESAGRVLVLLSGGIDSPVAAWSLMRRGCHCDFLHLHNLKSNEKVLNSKITKTIEQLNKFQFKSTLYTLPYETFEFGIIGKVVPRYELVIFKYYLLKLAEKIAKDYDYLAIANGDAIAQVASQTLINLNIVNHNINIPIFRPLLTFEKEEIITIANKIGTYELSIEEYKDCCSLVAKNPMTEAKENKFLESVEKLNFENFIEKSLEKLSKFKIN